MDLTTRVFALTALMGALFGCDVKPAVEKAADEIDRHIYALQQDSSQWRSSLQQTVADLKQAEQSALANDVQNVIDRSISDTGTATRFNIDFLGNRSQNVLRNVVSVLRDKNYVFISPPQIGSWVPKVVDLYLPPEQRTKIEFSGYDFSNKTKDGRGLQLILVLQDESSSDVTKYMSENTFYDAVVNTAGNGLHFPQNSKCLRLLWGDRIMSEVPVLVPNYSWHRSDAGGNVYAKTYSFISENMDGVDGGKIASGIFHLEVPNARIYRIDFRHEGDGAPWNYHPTNAPPNEYDGCTEILDGGTALQMDQKMGR